MPGILAGGEKALGGACKIVFFSPFLFYIISSNLIRRYVTEEVSLNDLPPNACQCVIRFSRTTLK
jgi:hypothetical protein